MPWLLAGCAFLVISCGLWWWRLQLVSSEQGVLFLPRMLHGRHSFFWSEVEEWRWHRTLFTNSDGGDDVEMELILVFAGGREIVLPSLSCCEEIVSELKHRIGPETPRFA